MIIRSGIDLIEIKRLEKSIFRYGDRFLERVFTPQEISDCIGNTASLAARFAAKEATAKALGCGIGKVSWLDVEVSRDPDHLPHLLLHGAARDLAIALNLVTWSVSLSHTHQHAIAMVVATGEG